MQAESAPSKTASIGRIPSETEDYDKYYVPKFVSIGPYHYNNSKLSFVQSLKPVFTKNLISENKEMLDKLYDKLGEANKIRELRGFYEGSSTEHLSDVVFTRMMLLDGCFVLCFVSKILCSKENSDFMGLKVNQIHIILEDLLLLENQIPYTVLDEVMKLVDNEKSLVDDLNSMMKNFDNMSGGPRRQWWRFQTNVEDHNSPHKIEKISKKNHLLQILQYRITYGKGLKQSPPDHYTFRNISELLDAGIKFRPSKTCSFADVSFVGGWFSSYLELPLIVMDDFGLTNMLNLSAYEMYHANDINGNIVTSYLCFLDSLIDHPEDVKVLRESKVLRSLLSDVEVAHQFNKATAGINFGLNRFAYKDVMGAIQKHCDTKPKRWYPQLKNNYLKSPWSFLALGGAVISLFLSAFQTYYTIWSLPGKCDDLCMFLKMNHHL